ncbi:hypothetical protein BBP40_006964 [Aspergillus hancockii]|nr:hypothetical protein BBP40_006964 [Aspergillus hancockii]
MANETILIPGTSGFIVIHIVDAFLRAGYYVRGTVRSEQTANKIRSTFPEYKDKLSFAIVPDFVRADAFDKAVRGVTGVTHTAAPPQMKVEDKERDLLRPTVKGTINILDSIKRNAPQVRRAVNTSSVADMLDLSKGTWPDHVYSEADWNPMNYTQATDKDIPDMAAYRAGKNVRDVAEAHIKAFEVSEGGSQRFLISEGNGSSQRVADILRERVAEVRDRVPLGKPHSTVGDLNVYGVDASKSEKALGLRYRPLEESRG